MASLIYIRGRVQGVGFRPFVARLARERSLRGWVQNDGSGVVLYLDAETGESAQMVQAIVAHPPPLARIESVTTQEGTPAAAEMWRQVALSSWGEGDAGFHIVPSQTTTTGTDALVTPDIAGCPSCMAEIFDPLSRRYRYPFTTCTDCGPRYSLLETPPFDREHTTMRHFALCEECRGEYESEHDRRFHAQTVACHACGPRAWLERADGRAFETTAYTMLDALDATTTLLQRGEIVAIQGLGGFHLCCDATNSEAVRRLREHKRRPHRPFALMVRDLSIAERHVQLDERARLILASPEAPICLLPRRPAPERAGQGERPGAALAEEVAPDQGELGLMLPYTPLHALVLRRMERPIVCTSGNVSESPQCIDHEEAKQKLGSIADWFLFHDRIIENRIDDSVVRTMGGSLRVLRRARGYAPEPLSLPPGFEVAAPIVMAMGAQWKATFCVVRGGRGYLSPHLGDLDDVETSVSYERSLMRELSRHAVVPEIVVTDLHEDYRSTVLGQTLASRFGAAVCAVQHHHAHIAACLGENGHPLDSAPVLGVTFDGLGLGLDHQLWGGEFLLADYRKAGRVACLEPVPLLGGDKAAREPWRNLYASLRQVMTWQALRAEFGGLSIVRTLAAKRSDLVESVLNNPRFSPLSSSAGRLFDAVAAALCLFFDEVSYEGQAAMALESLVDNETLEAARECGGYPVEVAVDDEGLFRLSLGAMWHALLEDLEQGRSRGLVAARFHVGLAQAIVQLASQLYHEGRYSGTVVLSGGVFQNRVLFEETTAGLKRVGLSVLTHRTLPPNDGCISWGQALVAMARTGV